MPNSPGFYGKFPELGDFVNRRLPSEFVDPWDEWMQGAIVTSREQLGERWLDHYLTSPLWRFVITAGLCGESPWMGVTMPSVDRVGRYFPLTLACRLPADANLVQLLTLGSGWFDDADDILLGALQEATFNMEDFDANVASLGNLDGQLASFPASGDIGFGTAWQIGVNNHDIGQPLAALTHQLLQQRMGRYSIWWGSGSASVQPSMLVCAELPQASDYAAMLTGDWQSGTWEAWPMPDGEAGRQEIPDDEGAQFTP